MPDYEYWLRLGLLGRFLHIPEVLATFRVHDESQTFAKADVSRSEEPIAIISRFFQHQNLPDKLAATKDEALSNAHLLSAQLQWRAGRFSQGYLTAKKAFSLYPRNLTRMKTVRIIINALFNRIGHKLFRFFKDIIHKDT